jgi:hypothetical protein
MVKIACIEREEQTMKDLRNMVGASFSVMVLFGFIGAGFGQESSPSKPPPKKAVEPPPKPPAQSAMPIYIPPKRGAPGGRIGGGTRGIQRDTFSLLVLAPDHTGLTSVPQPTLYWFVSSDLTTTSAELTIMDPEGTQPLLETRLSPPLKTGVHSFRLADHGVRLSPGIPYRWYVALVVDPDRRSKDILAGGFIELAGATEGLAKKVSAANKADLPRLYAEAGLWYDAIAAISQLIEAAPADAGLKQQRSALLEQAGLTEIVKLLK